MFAEDAEPHESPYLAQVRYRDDFGFRDEGVCGGSLISLRFVLTAAHCVMMVDIEDSSVVIILGAHKWFDESEQSRQRFVTKKFWIHENFSRKTIENDIAIVQLLKVAILNSFVKIIRISNQKNFSENTKLLFNGWGFHNESYLTANALQSAKMNVVPIDKCLMFKNHYWEALTEKNICAIGRNSQRVSKICNGDSGGPLVIEQTKELVGIASFVKDAENGKRLPNNVCDSPTVPDVFVRVSSYLDWISEKIGLKI